MQDIVDIANCIAQTQLQGNDAPSEALGEGWVPQHGLHIRGSECKAPEVRSTEIPGIPTDDSLTKLTWNELESKQN